MVLVGIYYSALSASQDQDIRQLVRNVAIKLLASISTAQMEHEVEMRVGRVTKRIQKTLLEESGISSSLEDEDIMEYTEMVINEVKSLRSLEPKRPASKDDNGDLMNS